MNLEKIRLTGTEAERALDRLEKAITDRDAAGVASELLNLRRQLQALRQDTRPIKPTQHRPA